LAISLACRSFLILILFYDSDLEDCVFYTEVSDYTGVSGMIINFEDEHSFEKFHFLFLPGLVFY